MGSSIPAHVICVFNGIVIGVFPFTMSQFGVLLATPESVRRDATEALGDQMGGFTWIELLPAEQTLNLESIWNKIRKY